jgi:hypothetical protein
VLPDAVPLTDDDAAVWLAAGIPRWVARYVPAALWLVTFIDQLLVRVGLRLQPAAPRPA